MAGARQLAGTAPCAWATPGPAPPWSFPCGQTARPGDLTEEQRNAGRGVGDREQEGPVHDHPDRLRPATRAVGRI